MKSALQIFTALLLASGHLIADWKTEVESNIGDVVEYEFGGAYEPRHETKKPEEKDGFTIYKCLRPLEENLSVSPAPPEPIHFIYVSNSKKNEFMHRYVAKESKFTLQSPFTAEEVYFWKEPIRIKGLLWKFGDTPVLIYK